MSGRPIRSFHAFNYSLHVPWFFPFYHPELSSARRAGRNKVQFLMRRQHQMVAFTAPGHMIAKPAPVGRFAFFPLDRDLFIESGHALPSGKAFYSRRLSNQKDLIVVLATLSDFVSLAVPCSSGLRLLSRTTTFQQPLSYISNKLW